MNQTAVFINLTASRAEKNLPRIRKIASKQKLTLKVASPESFKNELNKVLKTKPKRLVIGGGDGTVISAIDQALSSNYNGSFGIIPLGTSNYLARNLRISLTPATALRQSVKGTPHNIHLGKANDNIFSLMTDLGASVHVSKAVTYDQKKRFGQLAYLMSTLKALKSHSPFGYSIEYDDNNRLEGFCHNILVVNSSLSKQVVLAPDSKLSKDSFTVSVYKGKNNFALLLNVLLYMVSFGAYKRNIQMFEAKKISINTLPNQEYSVDGEVKHKTPLKITVLDKKVPIVTPKPKKVI